MGFMGGRPKGRSTATTDLATELPASRLDQLMTFVEKAAQPAPTTPSEPRAEEPVPAAAALAPAPLPPLAVAVNARVVFAPAGFTDFVEFPEPILAPAPRTPGSHAAQPPAIELPVVVASGGKRRLEVAASA